MRSLLPPYFHPSTVCFVDDNYGFSQSLLLTIPDDIYMDSYLSPEQALNVLNQGHPRQSLADLCFSKQGSLIQLDLNVLEQEIKHLDRFRRVSVLLVDYAMPTMNGLDFCASLLDRDIRRVLLTGVADEKTAVAAFNDGLIDHYLPKAKLPSPTGIVPYIRQQQQLYFQQFHTRLTHALGVAAPTFTEDPNFLSYFQSLIERHQIVEYYLVTEPISYLCLTHSGEAYQLLIQDERTKEQRLAHMQRYQAPAELMRAAEADKVQVCFYENPEDYLGDDDFPWADLAYEATQVNGVSETWLCSFVDDAPIDIDFDPTEASYARFIEDAYR